MKTLYASILALALLVGWAGTSRAEAVPTISGPVPVFLTSAVVTADTAIKSAPGYVDLLTCIGSDATATAGTIILYDNTAESGTVVVSWDVQAVAYSTPVIFTVRRAFTTGIYLGYTTTADVKCYLTYR